MTGGRLTLTPGTPCPVTDTTSQIIALSPCVGGDVSIYDGTSLSSYSFLSGPTDQNGITLDLSASPSSWPSGSIFDIGVTLISGVPVLCASPAWSSQAARGFYHALYSGIRTNAATMTCRHSSGTVSVPANQWTYLGTFRTDTQAYVTCHTSFGQSRQWGLWNNYNRRRIILKAGETTRGHITPYWGATNFGPTNNNSGNSVNVLVGLPEEQIAMQYDQAAQVRYAYSSTGDASAQFMTAISWNKTAGATPESDIESTWGQWNGERWDYTGASPNFIVTGMVQQARLAAVPLVGLNIGRALERFAFAANHSTLLPANDAILYGGNLNMLLTAEYWG